MKLLVALQFLVFISFPVGGSNAAVVVDQPLDPDGGYGYTANCGDQNILEDFLITSHQNVNRVTWWGLFSSGVEATSQSVASFDICFFRSDPSITATEPNSGAQIVGLPCQMPFYVFHAVGVAGTQTGIPDMLHGGNICEWTVDLPTVKFKPGKYWIDIRASSEETDFFLWEHSSSVVDSIAVHVAAAEFPFYPYHFSKLDRRNTSRPYPHNRQAEGGFYGRPDARGHSRRWNPYPMDADTFWSCCLSVEYYNTAQAFTLIYVAP